MRTTTKSYSPKISRHESYSTSDSWDEDSHFADGGISRTKSGLSKYIEPLFVYKTWFLGWMLASCLLGWLALLLWPRAYESDCRLQFNVGRETVGLDPTTTTTQTMMLQKSQEEDINSALSLLESRELAEMVVDELGVENILSGYLPSSGEEKKSFFGSLSSNAFDWANSAAMAVLDQTGIRDKITDQERAVIRVQDQMEISSPKKSTVMIVKARTKSPGMAQAMVKSLTRHFLTKHVNVTTTEGSLDFFDGQASAAEERVNDLLEKRSKMLQNHQIASVESKQVALTSQMASIESTILNAKGQRKRTESEIADLSERLKGLDEMVVSERQTLIDPGVSGMRGQLYALELEEKRRSALYTSNHPLLVQIREQNAAAREVLDKLKRESESQSTTPNPTLVNLNEDLLKSKNAAVGLDALLAESSLQRDEKQKEYRELLDFEVELSEVSREINVAQASLVTLRDKQEQARVVESLRNKRISSIAIGQPATFKEKPTDPKKPLVLAAALFLGLGGGLGLVGLKEFSRKTIRRPDEAERLLGFPVLASVPENISLRRDGLKSKKRTYKLLKSRKLSDVQTGCRDIMSELHLNTQDITLPDAPLGKTIGILGVRDGCGASSVAMLLALESSENQGLVTTLVDLDLRKQTISDVFGLFKQNRTGTELAMGKACGVDFFQQISRDTLGLVGSATRTHGRKVDFDVRGAIALLDELSKTNDIVFVDLPSINNKSNWHQIARRLDHVIIVIESEQTESRSAEQLVERLDRMNVDVAGIVVNKYQKRIPRWLEGLLG